MKTRFSAAVLVIMTLCVLWWRDHGDGAQALHDMEARLTAETKASSNKLDALTRESQAMRSENAALKTSLAQSEEQRKTLEAKISSVPLTTPAPSLSHTGRVEALALRRSL